MQPQPAHALLPVALQHLAIVDAELPDAPKLLVSANEGDHGLRCGFEHHLPVELWRRE